MPKHYKLRLNLTKDKTVYEGYFFKWKITVRQLGMKKWRAEIEFVSLLTPSLKSYPTNIFPEARLALRSLLHDKNLPNLLGIKKTHPKLALAHYYSIEPEWSQPPLSPVQWSYKPSVRLPPAPSFLQNQSKNLDTPYPPLSPARSKKSKKPFSIADVRCSGRSDRPECDQTGYCSFCSPSGRAALFNSN